MLDTTPYRIVNWEHTQSKMPFAGLSELAACLYYYTLESYPYIQQSRNDNIHTMLSSSFFFFSLSLALCLQWFARVLDKSWPRFVRRHRNTTLPAKQLSISRFLMAKHANLRTLHRLTCLAIQRFVCTQAFSISPPQEKYLIRLVHIQNTWIYISPLSPYYALTHSP